MPPNFHGQYQSHSPDISCQVKITLWSVWEILIRVRNKVQRSSSYFGYVITRNYISLSLSITIITSSSVHSSVEALRISTLIPNLWIMTMLLSKNLRWSTWMVNGIGLIRYIISDPQKNFLDVKISVILVD